MINICGENKLLVAKYTHILRHEDKFVCLEIWYTFTLISKPIGEVFCPSNNNDSKSSLFVLSLLLKRLFLSLIRIKLNNKLLIKFNIIFIFILISNDNPHTFYQWMSKNLKNKIKDFQINFIQLWTLTCIFL